MDVDDREAATLTVDHRLAAAKAADHSVLRCEVDDLRSLVADLVLTDLRGHTVDIAAAHRLVVDHRLAEDLRRWARRGHNAGSHQAVAHLSETAARDVRKWDHRG